MQKKVPRASEGQPLYERPPEGTLEDEEEEEEEAEEAEDEEEEAP